ncbi:MAG: hypothetical protein WCG07_00115 [Candidatus Taylorbacteria bacterium]
MKRLTCKNILVIAVSILGIAPIHAFAATVYIESSRNTISVGDTAVISVKINADAAVLNSVEGDITFKGNPGDLIIKEFSLASSSFGLWPRTPSLSTDGHTVSFVGGVPGGFSIEGTTMFKIIVQATKAGSVSVDPSTISVYLNDGSGTKAPVIIKGVYIKIDPKSSNSVTSNDWLDMISTDRISPEPFSIVDGQDNSLFSGKKFVYFTAVDNQSGIDHYDVSEDGGPVVRSGSTYVFQDQSGNATLNVTAYDKAGNKRSATYPLVHTLESQPIHWYRIIIAVIILLLAVGIYKRYFKK